MLSKNKRHYVIEYQVSDFNHQKEYITIKETHAYSELEAIDIIKSHYGLLYIKILSVREIED